MHVSSISPTVVAYAEPVLYFAATFLALILGRAIYEHTRPRRRAARRRGFIL